MKLGHSVALVTLTQITGRSSRPLGAQMIVFDDGRYCGFVAGGCVEGAIAAEAVESLAEGRGRTLRLGEGSPFFDIALPCGGGITIDIRTVESHALLEAASSALTARQPFALMLDPHGGASFTTGNHDTGWQEGRFCRAYQPGTRLVVIGRGLEAEALVRVAVQSGLDVSCATPDQLTLETVRDSTARVQHLATPEMFDPEWVDAHCAVAMLFHDLDWELPLLRRVLIRPAFYIGALGSQTTHGRRVAALEAAKIDAEDIARIRGPIGAFGPTKNADSLAISILADVMAAARSKA
jgi:xanthine dehydrogenase accessory factor